MKKVYIPRTREDLVIDPSSGSFLSWIRPSPFHPNAAKTNAGWQAGAFDHQSGYWQVFVNGKLCRAHRIVYELFHGSKIPQRMEIDHIDRNRGNNNPNNLRLCTKAQNLRNWGRIKQKPFPKNIYWCNTWKRFFVKFVVDGVTKKTRHKTIEEAINQANRLRVILHGEFASTEGAV